MAVRRRTHLRTCAGAVLLCLPLAATSTTVSSTPRAAALPPPASSSPLGTSALFSGALVTPASRLDPAATARLARRVKAAGDQRLEAASPTRLDQLDGLDEGVFDALDIPRTALVAYQVAATTMAAADPDCGVDWTLLAAIGRVETDHGRHDGATLRADGVARPLIRGVALDGKGPVALIRDTDGGQLDDDRRWDRAVGPMQFLPGTWGYAGVDGDGDGVRSPDNINDAALAAAVYLCAAPGALDGRSGVRAAVYRYNPSDAYVDLVLHVAKAYSAGDLTQLPTGGTTLALGAIEAGSSAGRMTGPQTTPGSPGGQGSTNRDGTGGQRDEDGDRPGKGTTEDTTAGTGDGEGPPGNGDRGGARLEDPVEALPGVDSEGPLPGFEPKDPKPPKDPDPTPEPPPDPEPTEDPEPVLVELTGTLTLVEDAVVDDEGTPVDQWRLLGVNAAGVAFDLELGLGDEEWLQAPALANLDGDVDADGNEAVETNYAELVGLRDLGAAVTVQVEEGTEPAVVHTINHLVYLPSE